MYYCKDSLLAVDLVKDVIHLLKTSICCLGVEVAHTRDHERVDDCEDVIGLIAVEGYRRDHNDETVENPIG